LDLEKILPRFIIVATSTFEYEVPVIAEDEEEALATLDDWIAEDFAHYQKDATWSFEVVESE
jgi:hypothetical protein